MEYDIQSSINKFESKKDFRQVKLMTRKSFREDQNALNKRLSLRTNQAQKLRVRKMDPRTIPGVNGSAETKASTTEFGNMVLDSKQELTKQSETGEYVNNGYSDVDDVKLDMTLTEDVEIELPQYFVRGFTSSNQPINGDVNVNSVNADHGAHVIVNGENNATDRDTNKDHSETGDPLPSGEFLVRRPTIRETPRGCATPEPRLKVNGHIYKKNEKLTSGRTYRDKLADDDGIKVIEPGSQRTDLQYVPVVPGMEVPFLPANGSLRGFTVEQMVTVFRLLAVPENVIFHLSYRNIDGHRFSMLNDLQLEELGIKNAIVCYFRDRSRSVAVNRRRPKFML